MFELLGVPPQALFGQLLLGLINGAFYALLSLGLAVIFGLLNIINFTHGAQYMMGAFAAWMLLHYVGVGYWWALLLAPIIVGALGIVHRATDAVAAVPPRSPLRAAAHLRPGADHPGPVPPTVRLVRGCPTRSASSRAAATWASCSCLSYRGWVIVFSLVVCLGTWFVIERTKLGSYLRAATERPDLGRTPDGAGWRALRQSATGASRGDQELVRDARARLEQPTGSRQRSVGPARRSSWTAYGTYGRWRRGSTTSCRHRGDCWRAVSAIRPGPEPIDGRHRDCR